MKIINIVTLLLVVSCNVQAQGQKKTDSDLFFENQLLKVQKINQLNYDLSTLKQQEKIARIKVELNKSLTKLEPFDKNIIAPSSVGNHTINVESKADTVAIKTDDNHVFYLKQLDSLQIDAVLGNSVLFKNFDKTFAIGDTIYKNIKIIDISGSKITLELPNGSKKTLTMDWLK